MGGNYEKSMYNQLMEVMARLDAVEQDLHTEKIEHKNDVDRLNARIDFLEHENQLLKDDNTRLRSIINNDSSNTSLPPSTDQKGGKPANTYNSRRHTERKAVGQKGHKGTTLTKAEVEELMNLKLKLVSSITNLEEYDKVEMILYKEEKTSNDVLSSPEKKIKAITDTFVDTDTFKVEVVESKNTLLIIITKNIGLNEELNNNEQESTNDN